MDSCGGDHDRSTEVPVDDDAGEESVRPKPVLRSVQLLRHKLIDASLVFLVQPSLHLLAEWLNRIDRIPVSFVKNEEMAVAGPFSERKH